jgi:hypothetical protein
MLIIEKRRGKIMTLSMKYDQDGLFHHPVTLPEFKLIRKQLDDACVISDTSGIVMMANQLIPDLICEEEDKVDIDKRADDLTEEMYVAFGSDTGILFGIPSGRRQAVRAVIKQVLKVEGWR